MPLAGSRIPEGRESRSTVWLWRGTLWRFRIREEHGTPGFQKDERNIVCFSIHPFPNPRRSARSLRDRRFRMEMRIHSFFCGFIHWNCIFRISRFREADGRKNIQGKADFVALVRGPGFHTTVLVLYFPPPANCPNRPTPKATRC